MPDRLDTLRELTEPPGPTPAALDIARRRLQRVIVATPPRRRARLSRRSAAIILVPVVLATAAGTYFLGEKPILAAGVGCFDAVREDANIAIVRPTGELPGSICARMWAAGQVAPSRREVPPMQACLLDTGAVGVFPAADACRRLGLRPLPGDYVRRARRISALSDALIARLGRECVPAERARLIAREEIARAGLAGWRPTVSGFSRAYPCATLALDDRTREVKLIGFAHSSVTPR